MVTRSLTSKSFGSVSLVDYACQLSLSMRFIVYLTIQKLWPRLKVLFWPQSRNVTYRQSQRQTGQKLDAPNSKGHKNKVLF